MFGTTFYHGTTKKLIIAFGSVFNNIHVQRMEADGTLIKDIKIPLAYESRKKYLARLIQDSRKNKEVPQDLLVLVFFNFESEKKRYCNTKQKKKDKEFFETRLFTSECKNIMIRPVPMTKK